jgi:hypothetical protein
MKLNIMNSIQHPFVISPILGTKNLLMVTTYEKLYLVMFTRVSYTCIRNIHFIILAPASEHGYFVAS